MNSSLSQRVTLTIGRSPDNDIPLQIANISSHHAELIIDPAFPEDVFLLKDNKSKHGTGVQQENGQYSPIKEQYVNRQDIIRFAINSDYSTNDYRLEDILPDEYKLKPIGSKTNPLDFTKEFAALKSVPEQYKKDRKRIKNIEVIMRLMALVAVCIGLTMLKNGGIQSDYLAPTALIAIVAAIVSALLNTEDKLERLATKFKGQYRCPKPGCKNRFVQDIPWEEYAEEKTCPRCKAIWVV